MYKYILLKKYPSLPNDWEEGMTVGQGDRSMLSSFSPTNGKYTDSYIDFDEITNYPEYWERLGTKRTKRKRINTQKHTINFSKYTYLIGKRFKIIAGDLGYIDYEITHLYDYFGILFGNLVPINCHFGVDMEYGINVDDIIENIDRGVWCEMKSILKTNDDIEIFDEDQRLYGVLPKGSWETHNNIKAKRALTMKSWLWFANEENAKKYLFYNKPKFSVTDVNIFKKEYREYLGVTDPDDNFKSNILDLNYEKK